MKCGKACVQLGRRVLEYISNKETHFRIWEDVLRMSVNPTLKVERVTPLELLDRLIIPALEHSQKGDEDQNSSSRHLARLWLRRVLSDLKLAQLMLECKYNGNRPRRHSSQQLPTVPVVRRRQFVSEKLSCEQIMKENPFAGTSCEDDNVTNKSSKYR